MSWLTPYTAPLVYAAVLLLVAFVGPASISRHDQIALNVAGTFLYLVWLSIAAFGKWRKHRVRTRNAPPHTRNSRSDSGDVKISGTSRRVRLRVRRFEGETLDD